MGYLCNDVISSKLMHPLMRKKISRKVKLPVPLTTITDKKDYIIFQIIRIGSSSNEVIYKS